jgi:hypothetical protein
VGPVSNRQRISNPPAAAFFENLPTQNALLFMATFHSRRLPHFYSVGQPLFVTWRLHDSLPPGRVFAPATTSGQSFVAMDRLLDNARTGAQHLRRPALASMVVKALHYEEEVLATTGSTPTW